MTAIYDLVVIGAGSGGVRAARLAAQAGKKVAVIESSRLGGTCVNVGCIPKKLMWYAGHMGEQLQEAVSYGWQPTLGDREINPFFDWQSFKLKRDAEILRLNGIYGQLLENSGVEILTGTAKFVAPQTIAVGETQLSTQHTLIATGSTATPVSAPGGDLVATSDALFDLEAAPKSAIVLGGGYIAVEYASILTMLGVETTLIYRGKQLLRGFDHSLGTAVAKELRRLGTKLLLDTQLQRVEKDGTALRVVTETHGDHRAEFVVSAYGRHANTGDLQLDKAGVVTDANGWIQTDGHWRTSQQHISAIGDVAGTPQLTPYAIRQAHEFVDHWLGNAAPLPIREVATAIFAAIPCATVGITEAEAAASERTHLVFESEFRELRATLLPEPAQRNHMKMLVEKESGRVVGVHLAGEAAPEIMQLVAVAVAAQLTKAQFDTALAIHPTVAEELVTFRTPSREV